MEEFSGQKLSSITPSLANSCALQLFPYPKLLLGLCSPSLDCNSSIFSFCIARFATTYKYNGFGFFFFNMKIWPLDSGPQWLLSFPLVAYYLMSCIDVTAMHGREPDDSSCLFQPNPCYLCDYAIAFLLNFRMRQTVLRVHFISHYTLKCNVCHVLGMNEIVVWRYCVIWSLEGEYAGVVKQLHERDNNCACIPALTVY